MRATSGRAETADTQTLSTLIRRKYMETRRIAVRGIAFKHGTLLAVTHKRSGRDSIRFLGHPWRWA